MRKRRLQVLKTALPKMKEALRGWIRRMLHKRKSHATVVILDFAKATRSIGDIPLAIKRYLHHVRVLQRNIRGHYMRTRAILEIRKRQLHRHEEELAKLQKNKQPKQISKAAKERKAECEDKILKKILKRQMEVLGKKLHSFREELAQWKEEKKEHDRIEEARAAVMADVGIKEDRKNRKEFKRRPQKPHLVVGLNADELKSYVKEVARQERAAAKSKEDSKADELNTANVLEELAGVKPGKSKKPMRP